MQPRVFYHGTVRLKTSAILLKNSTVAILLTAAVTAIRYLFGPGIGSRGPFLLYTLAAAVAAQIGGAVSGLITTALGAAIIFAYAPPTDPYMHTALALFAGVGVILSVFGEWRKRADDERRGMLDELKRAHDRLALRHDIARIGSFEWFAGRKHYEWSPEMETIYGISTPTRRHEFEEWMTFIHPEDRAEIAAALEETVRSRRSSFDHTHRVVRPNGDIRWVHSRRKYDYDAQGNPAHIVGINMDVTDVKRGEMAEEILGGLMQVCSACRRIHNEDDGQWYSMEGYLVRRGAGRLSHGMCPDCGEQWLAEEKEYDRPARG